MKSLITSDDHQIQKKKKIMNIENTKRRCVRKGVLEFYILSVLKRKCLHWEILDTLKNAKLLVVEGTVYPLLTRLKKWRFVKLPLGRINFRSIRKYYGLELGKTF
jgi:PadR family transcriptional regulator PadR